MSQVVSYFRNLLHINPNKRQRVEESQEAPNQKYRRVNNNFPLKHSSPIDDDIKRKKVRQEQSKYKEIMDRYHKKEPFKAFNVNDDDEEFSDSEFDFLASKNRVTTRNDNFMNQRRRSNPHHRQHEQQPSFSGYSGFSQHNDRRIPSLIPISKSVMNGTTNNGNQKNTRNGMSQSISPQLTNGKKNVFSFKKKPTTHFQDSSINSIMVRNYKTKVRDSYEQLLKQLVPSTDNKKNSGLPSLTPFTKPLTFATVDLSKDDDEETVAVAMKSIKESKNSYYGRNRDLVFKIPDTSFVDLFDDENETVNLRKSILSSTLASERVKNISESMSSSSLKTITSSDIQPVNSLKDRQSTRSNLHDIESICKRYTDRRQQRDSLIREERETVSRLSETTRANEKIHGVKVRDYISALEQITISDDDEDEPENEYPEFDERQHNFVTQTLYSGSKHDVVIVKFSISITRNDLYTLVNENWLNDEVINFYMNLLIDRSEKNDSLPKIYAMNTFFIPKLLQSGHAGLKRWTRKVDIFSFDVIPIPVHVSGVHWCMSIIHLKNKTIKYYDSMGQTNNRVLDSLEQYLKDESLDKKKVVFDMSDWTKESVQDCPRQSNGSDCGVFSCMFAEFVSRDSRISFSQEKMQYFRKKMIYEIATGRLMLHHND